MKTLIAVLTLLLSSIPALAQSACGQLGVDCRHPTVAPRPSPPSNGGTQSDSSDDSGVSHREYKNFYKSVDLGDKARKNKDKNPAQALHYLDEALALRRVSGETRKQDHWAWLECERGTVLIKLGRYDDALGSFSQCAGEDITDKNQEAYQQWVKWGEQAVEADKNPWAPLAVEVTGDVTVIGMDGREWHGDFEHANLKFATIKVAPNAKFKMLLPDETVFTILLSDIGAEIEMDDFVYDSNFDLQVLLWGTVVEHEHGWRAQFAYPKTLHLPCDTLPVTLAEMESRLHSLVPYRCNIFVDHDGGSVPIWRKDSGLHPAGLDFLMTRGKEWYAQRKHRRSLKPGDRIAVGRGIAVVEHADAHQVHALWKRGKLRLRRKDIAWDDVNSRWELNGSA